MNPPPCNCAHIERIIVWVRGHKTPIKQRHDRCIHPSGPHPMHEFCAWRTNKTEGAAKASNTEAHRASAGGPAGAQS